MFSKANLNEIPLDKLTEVLFKAKAGKEEALTQLYNHYFERVYRFIYYRVSHREVAEDLTEDVFVKLFKYLPTLKQTAAFEGWLFQIARNQVIDYYRSKKHIVAIEEIENTLEYETNIVDIVNLKTEQTLLIKLLKELSADQQLVIKLKFIEDLPNETIAHIIDKPEGTVRVLQHRAIARLKELLDEHITKKS